MKSLAAVAFITIMAASSHSFAQENKKQELDKKIESLREDLRYEMERRMELEKLIDDLTKEKENSQGQQVIDQENGAQNAEGEPATGEAQDEAPDSNFNHGIELTGRLTAIAQGMDKKSKNVTGQTFASYSAEIEMILHQNENFYMVMGASADAGSGANEKFASDILPDYSARRTLSHEGKERFSLYQAYLEGLFFERSVAVNIGKMDIHSLYDENILAGNEKIGFLSGALTRAAGTVGHALDYTDSVGARILVSPWSFAEGQIIYAHSGMDGLDTAPFWAVQLTGRPRFGDLEGNYRFYTAYDGRNYHDFSGRLKSDVVYGFNMDQFVRDYVGFFLRWSSHGKDIVENRVSSMYSAGLTLAGGLWGRMDDLVGAGAAALELNDKSTLPYSGGQRVLEVYYNLRINPMIAVTFDIQAHSNLPKGEDRSLLVGALRAHMDF